MLHAMEVAFEVHETEVHQLMIDRVDVPAIVPELRWWWGKKRRESARIDAEYQTRLRRATATSETAACVQVRALARMARRERFVWCMQNLVDNRGSFVLGELRYDA